MPAPRAGDVWDVRFDPVEGAELGGTRPAIVVSNDGFHDAQPYLCWVVPITGTDRGIPYHLRLPARVGGLSKQSIVLCEQARFISVQRLLTRRGAVSAEVVTSIRLMMARLIDATDDF